MPRYCAALGALGLDGDHLTRHELANLTYNCGGCKCPRNRYLCPQSERSTDYWAATPTFYANCMGLQ
jgi:hypothetical protein